MVIQLKAIMQRVQYICLLLIMIFTSCKKDNSTGSPVISNETYVGTFQRQGGQVSAVSLTFNSGHWSGQSQFPKYPALCNGTFDLIGPGQVAFENACAWTAEFDWSLILSGTYKMKIYGDTLELSKDYAGNLKDVYLLTKQ